ncbi:hybrid sensor histidine kinase/response regulator [Massilia rhizosphaerae]|uniref:hybrid sensor histidine kinase/response regulator n=1 Tax=Massilia rhizosphaerae TaxID=2784389 RepID=UPI0018DCBF1A|nr:PAS domain S-box protein [Massilia rhizosphaerae]
METQPTCAPCCVDDVLITAELERRPRRAPDYAAENRAMAALARQLALDPHGVPQKLAELVLDLCDAGSAGISLLEEQDGARVFRWRAAAGLFAAHLDGTVPFDVSPCGAVVDRNQTMLMRHGERCFAVMAGFDPPMIENLLVPWTAEGRAVGTVWVISHRLDRHFDAEDARVLRNLADFAAAAYQAIVALEETAEGRRELVQAAEERTRVLAGHNRMLEHEIAQRRQADEALRASEQRYRDLIGAIPAGVVACDAAGNVVFHNACADRLCGGPPGVVPACWGPEPEAAQGCRFANFAAPLRAVLGGGEPVVDCESSIERSDGSRIDVLLNISALRDHAGGIAGAVNIVQDITARKRVEGELRASELRFRTLSNTVPVLIWQNDVEGRNVFVNQYYLDFTGKSLEAVLGSGWHDLLHPDDAPAYVAGYMEAVRTRRPWRNLDRVRRRDGQWRWFDNYAQPLFAPDGSYAGHVGAALDITDAVLAEQALKETDRRKDDFLAVLAHELRNPLAPISNAVHLLRHPDGRRRADRLVEMLGRQVRQMIKLVDDLLEISRITRDKIELHRQPLLLADVVQGAVETSRPLIDQHRHHLDVRLPDEALTLHADSVRLTQVLANLLNNAAKYTDAGGRIELAARRDGDDVEIAVRDNGIGIPPANLPDVFDMFTQAHRAAGRGEGGLGIGLAMVRSLVQMHGGTVEARSAGPGQGSEFVVRLPLADRHDAAGDAGTAAHAAPLAGPRILVVDDNQDAADTLAMLLEADGARARAVYDGQSALAAMPGLRPHAVLLDLGMPGMDGLEVARRIRADPAWSGVRLVALTGWGQASDRERTRGAGFDFHLTKPVDLGVLRAWLGAVIGGHGVPTLR